MGGGCKNCQTVFSLCFSNYIRIPGGNVHGGHPLVIGKHEFQNCSTSCVSIVTFRTPSVCNVHGGPFPWAPRGEWGSQKWPQSVQYVSRLLHPFPCRQCTRSPPPIVGELGSTQLVKKRSKCDQIVPSDALSPMYTERSPRFV